MLPTDPPAAPDAAGIRLYRQWRRLRPLLAPVVRPERKVLAAGATLLLLAVIPDVAAPLLVRRIFDVALPAGDIPALIGLTAAVVGLALCAQGCRYLQALLAVNQRSRIRYRLMRRLLRHVLRLPYTFHLRHDSRLLSSRLRDDIAALEGLMPDALAEALVNLGRAALFLGLLIYLDPMLAAAAVVLVGLLGGGFALSNRVLRRHSRRALDRGSEAGAAMLDTLSGLLTVRTTAQEPREARRTARHLAGAERSRARRDLWGRTANSGIGAVGVIGTYLVVALGAWRVMAGASTVGTLFSFFLLLTQTVSATQGLVALNPQWQRGRAALDRMDELISRPAEPWLVAAGPHRPERSPAMRGEVALENVWLSYGDGPPVLRDVTMRVRPGELVAVVGPSGAGKSSLLLLLPRLLSPTSGHLLLDGRPYPDYPLAELRRQVAFLPQEVFIFHRSLRDNLTFANPGAGDEAVRRAVQEADAESFVAELPEGYDTLLGERGGRLSGGQRQRIALARELLRDAPVLVLDEATSALDAVSEAAVRRTLARQGRRRACLVVAHRLSTVLAADRIVVLDRGRVVARGTHDELQAGCRLYRRLCRLQLIHTDGAVPAPGPAVI